jgi:hypothetical protein
MHKPLLLAASAKLNAIHNALKGFLAITAGHVIVVFGEEESFFDLMEQRLYIPAFIGSVLIAFSMIECVFRVTVWLEQKYKWETHSLIRSAWQFLLGVLGITLLSVVEAVIYFKLRGTHVLDTRYFALDFLPIALFVITLNACYSFLCHLGLGAASPKELPEEGLTAETVLENEVPLKQELAETSLVLNETVDAIFTAKFIRDLRYVYIANNVRIAVDYKKRETVIDLSMEAIASKLPAEDFIMNNQSFIISREIIANVEPDTSRRFKLHLKPPFDELTNEHAYKVSQRFSPDFKKWW